MLRRLIKWLVVFPLRCIAEVAVLLFDMIVSRYLIAACVVAVFWVPSYLLFGATHSSFSWPTLVLGVVLCGLWEGCQIFAIRDFLAKFGIVSAWDA